jgi:hypothetical protein
MRRAGVIRADVHVTAAMAAMAVVPGRIGLERAQRHRSALSGPERDEAGALLRPRRA